MQSSNSELILIVDDNLTNLDVLAEILGDAGYEVAIAISGERALKLIQYSQPDLILLDVMMPGLDGYQTCQSIKEHDAWKSIPIVFMTALADAVNKVKGLELGAVDYITKPFQEEEILARIKTHLRLHHSEIKLRQSEARMESILNSLEEVVWSASHDLSEFIYLNPAVEDIFHCPSEQILQSPSLWFEMVHPEDKERFTQAFQSIEEKSSLELEYRIIDGNGSTRWLKIRAQKIKEVLDGHPDRIDGVLSDISDRKDIENQLHHESFHDKLTGLPNRSCFISQSNQLLGSLEQSPESNFAVLFIDLNRFKGINDSLGHQFGDQILQEVASRISQSLRPTDLIARVGSDEFAILLHNNCTPEETIQIAERMNERLSEAMYIEEQMIYSSASIGIVLSSSDYQNGEELLRDADIAMYYAKEKGKAGSEIFNLSMHEASVRQLELEQDLRIALSRKEITLNYQPILNLEDQFIFGFEALARWIHPQKGFISPADFIPIAEESGLIETLGEQVLWEACRQLQKWSKHIPTSHKLSMSVNLSGKQLLGNNFLQKLDTILEETNTSGEQLKLEITESILMDDNESLNILFQQLLERGITLSLDDFGTGYSSLSYLHRFPLNELKIDRSFINRIETDTQSQEIVKTIVTLAQTLDMSVVAEGVETQEQLDYLESLNCQKAQGYFFSKPLPEGSVKEWIELNTLSSIPL